MNDFGRPKSAHGPFGAHQHSRATAAAQVAMQSLEGSASRSVRNIRKAASVRAGRGNAARRAQRKAAAPRLCIKMCRRTAPATRLAWHTNIGRSHTPPKLPIRSTSTRSSAYHASVLERPHIVREPSPAKDSASSLPPAPVILLGLRPQPPQWRIGCMSTKLASFGPFLFGTARFGRPGASGYVTAV